MKMNKRRQFSDEFKTEAVRRVREEGRTANSVAVELGIPRGVMGNWLRRASQVLGESPKPEPLAEDERTELLRLRQEVQRLRMEKEILKKATAFFAKKESQ